jgi:hypothetical protein
MAWRIRNYLVLQPVLTSTRNPATLIFWLDWTTMPQAHAHGTARHWTGLADGLEKLLGRHVALVNPRYIRNPYFFQTLNNSRTVYHRQIIQVAG